tara:strand:- start:405 stop:755 length:351 start_codon:yes stop_codon:yes gene_type:complete
MLQTTNTPKTVKMIPCIKCNEDMPELRLSKYGYKVCVNCSTVSTKRGIPVTKGTGDHTWTETIIMEEDQYQEFVLATAIERGDVKSTKAEMLNMEAEDKNLQGPFQIINNIDKDRS